MALQVKPTSESYSSSSYPLYSIFPFTSLELQQSYCWKFSFFMSRETNVWYISTVFQKYTLRIGTNSQVCLRSCLICCVLTVWVHSTSWAWESARQRSRVTHWLCINSCSLFHKAYLWSSKEKQLLGSSTPQGDSGMLGKLNI